MKSIGQALRELLPCFEPLGIERKPLLSALGRILAEDVLAREDLPAFDNSAMDGYAVRLQALAPDRPFRIVGESRAGGALPPPLAPDTAMRIFTGAPMPVGADTVVIQEHARADGSQVAFERLPALGAHVRLKGSDMRAGSIALRAGTRVEAGEIGLLAAQGQSDVPVFRAPRVAVLSTGDELREIDDAPTPGTIVNSNAYALCAQLLAVGAVPWVLPSVPDRREAVAAAISRALSADVVLCSGGVSVGEYDFVARAFEDAGVKIVFWKVAIKPGKPLLFGMAGRVPVLGLPGNPVSAMIAFEVFVKPGLLRMQGEQAPYPVTVGVELAHDHRHGTGRVELARAVLHRAEDGRLRAVLHALQGSGSVPSMAGVDALVVLDAEVEHFMRGTRLPALLLRKPPGGHDPPFA
jgi:molybdopterin molybdotransferase